MVVYAPQAASNNGKYKKTKPRVRYIIWSVPYCDALNKALLLIRLQDSGYFRIYILMAHCRNDVTKFYRHRLKCFGISHTSHELDTRFDSALLCFALVMLQCQKLGTIITDPTYELLLSFKVISDVYRSFIPNKSIFTKHYITQWISQELWNPLRQAVPSKFHRSGGYNKRNCLPVLANFHGSRA